MGDVLERVLGAALMLLVLSDVFLTVLYARMGTSFLASRVARGTWKVFRLFAGPLPLRRRNDVLSFCGPAILVLMVGTWALGLVSGAALIIHPALGGAVLAADGVTPRGFVAALHAAGNSLSVVGSGAFLPHTPAYRLLYTANSLTGTAVLSLTLTYLMQVYTALRERNELGLKLHLMSGGTADAVEILAGLAPEGNPSGAFTMVGEMGSELVRTREAHHFYPVLFFFRFREPYYSVSRFTLLTMDLASLLRSGLAGPAGWLKESATVELLWRSGLKLATTLGDNFLAGGAPRDPPPADAERLALWARRYRAALRRLRDAGIRTVQDEDAGEALYLRLRQEWCPHIAALAPYMGYDMDEIDLAGSDDPEAPDRRPPFHGRRHAAG